ncbi:T-cell immunomodulatory protein-like [Oppia nitens]|uniref:T-cell immunomodulatory protein-like n=1 Tax=Oppia nitens TaxID=1686743 RepID=UPI0023DBEA09|nr:T-cell immunomodulatory protein-like [Oppia nitens]
MWSLISMYVLILWVIICQVVIASKEKLIEDNINGLIAAFGDFDSDRFTDVFVITDDGKSFEIFKGYPTEPVLRKWPSLMKCTFNTTTDTIVGLIPADFSGKAMMDVLVVTTSDNKNEKFSIYLVRGTTNQLLCNYTTTPLVKDVKSHPFILDFNGDMISDFIVETDNKSCVRQLWTLSGLQLKPECPHEIQNENNLWYFPNSNAFINLNDFVDDMTADIFISGQKHMEIYNNSNGFKQRNKKFIQYPENYERFGQSAFVDLNIDGKMDHIMPVCRQYKDLNCKDPHILAFDSNEKNWKNISDFTVGNDSGLTFSEIQFNKQFLPITLRHGDIDGDGYIDLIAIMRDNKNKFKAVVLKNVRDNSEDNPFKRRFVIDWTSDRHVGSDVDVFMVGFIDLFEDGKLDLLMTTKDSNNKLTTIAIVNTWMIDACFLKVLVTSGLCYGSTCPRGNIPYGTNQYGPYVCYQLQDMDGNMQTACAGQLSQAAHSALQMPYSVFGLGETPNFVENVHASIPSGRILTRESKWTQIVPDAQVVLIPFPPNDTSNWIVKLFYTPSTIVFSTLITLASICCFLVLIIGILHRKELLEDLAEHEEYKRHWPESR